MGFGVFFFSSDVLSSSSSGASGSTSATTRASRLESGDHARSETTALKSVSLTASPPRRLIRYTCVFLPSRSERKASHSPFGLKRGLVSDFLPEVRRRGSPPSVDTR